MNKIFQWQKHAIFISWSWRLLFHKIDTFCIERFSQNQRLFSSILNHSLLWQFTSLASLWGFSRPEKLPQSNLTSHSWMSAGGCLHEVLSIKTDKFVFQGQSQSLFKPMLHSIWKPTIWFALKIKWLVSIWSSKLGWNELNYLYDTLQ